jgi:hypothetical protein
VAHQLGECPRPLALAVAADLGHRDLEIVVEDRPRHAAEEGEGRDMAVQEGFRGLGRILPRQCLAALRGFRAF